MQTYDYILIGGGMTAASAVQGIRAADGSGTIAVFSAERHPPYKRPPLSKKLWQGKPEESIWSQLPGAGLELILGCRVASLDPERKQVQDEQGQVYGYKRLLLATGGAPRKLPFAPPETNYYRTLDDYHTVRGWTGHGERIGIIGGGFIGSEMAAALAQNGEQAVMVFPENSMGTRIYPNDLSEFVTRYYKEKGVEVHAGVEVQAVERSGDGFVLQGKGGQQIAVDHILAGIGIRPNIELAQAAGLAVAAAEEGGGIWVDEQLRTSQADIFAAGDAASFFNPALGKHLRVEHADNAESMGHTAGLNLAGKPTAYRHLPYFYSDLFDLGYEAVGELDARLETAAEWQDPFCKGVVYYLRDGRVRGVLLWNTWGQVDAARQLIAAGTLYRPGLIQGG